MRFAAVFTHENTQRTCLINAISKTQCLINDKHVSKKYRKRYRVENHYYLIGLVSDVCI